MSLRANIEHLAAAQGIVAVSVLSPAGPREFRGDEAWSSILDAAHSLLDKTEEKTIRLVVGKHTVVLQTEAEETVAVVLPTGHAIAKSLRRMIRRMSRKPRGPLIQQPAAAAPAPTAQLSGPPAAPSAPAAQESGTFQSPWG
ncbi:MAG: hypothetical protein K0V04_16020 [Deltaproteobacteria bacterium]|nr:hypothetical protein [Deltaproteobacteria bacterium]